MSSRPHPRWREPTVPGVTVSSSVGSAAGITLSALWSIGSSPGSTDLAGHRWYATGMEPTP